MSKFSELQDKIGKEKGMTKEGAGAIAAWAGRAKFGKAKFQAMAAAGKAKAAGK